MKNKGNLLAGFFAVVAFVTLAFAGTTVFDSIKLRSNTIVDSGGTTRITMATSGTNLTFTGAVQQSSTTFSGTAQPIAFAPSFITLGTTVARSTGTIAFDSSWVLYVATGTGNANQWVKVGGQ